MAKKKTKSVAKGFSKKSQSLNTYLQKFDRYIDKGKWSQARALLKDMDASFPSSPKIFDCWLTFAEETENGYLYQKKASEFIENHPDEPESYLALAYACQRNDYLILAVDALKTFCERFPEHPEVDDAQQDILQLEGIVTELMEHHHLSEAETFKRGKLNGDVPLIQ